MWWSMSNESKVIVEYEVGRNYALKFTSMFKYYEDNINDFIQNGKYAFKGKSFISVRGCYK